MVMGKSYHNEITCTAICILHIVLLLYYRKMFLVSGYMGLVSLISAYFWYLSLPRTRYSSYIM